MNDVKPCMGGFCALREKCQHYVAPTSRQQPAERLCDRGMEREMFFRPMAVHPAKEAA